MDVKEKEELAMTIPSKTGGAFWLTKNKQVSIGRLTSIQDKEGVVGRGESVGGDFNTYPQFNQFQFNITGTINAWL